MTQELEKHINFKSGVDITPGNNEPVKFWFKAESKKNAKILAEKYKKILGKASIDEATTCFILRKKIDGVNYRVVIHFPQQQEDLIGEKMKDLFEEYKKVRERFPNLKNLPAYKFLRECEELLVTEEIHILSRAHSASRAGEWHDTESSLYEKKLLKDRYNIGPEWKGPRCV